MYIEGGRIIFSFLSHVPLSSGRVEHSRKAVWFQMRFLAHFVYSEPSVLSLLARPILVASQAYEHAVDKLEDVQPALQEALAV